VYEVELKFPVADVAAIERQLAGLAATFGGPVEQVDRYFAHPCRDFAATDEALRLRRAGDALAITWKGPKVDAAAKTRREIELPIAGPAAMDGWTDLLTALGFQTVREVVKRRRTAVVEWQGSRVELALDHVLGLGDFLEIETQAAAADLAAAGARVEALARRLGCTHAERRSYLELVLGCG
jgi:adenylate cyclase class 2